MKKTTIALAALAFSGAVLAGGPDPMVAPAAQDTMYLGFHADMTQSFHKNTRSNTERHHSSEMGFDQGGFQFGMLFGAIRAEISADYSSHESSTNNTVKPSLSAFAKGAYDLKLGHGLTVYPVAGIGLIHTFQHYNNSTAADDKAATDFAWLLGAGTTLALNDKTSISGEYNWVNSMQDDVIDSSQDTKNSDFGKNVFSIRWNRTF